MVVADPGDDRDRGIDRVRRVPRAAEPDLQDRDAAPGIGEGAEGKGQEELEGRRLSRCRRAAAQRRDRRVQRPDPRVERRRSEQRAVDPDALAELLEVR